MTEWNDNHRSYRLLDENGEGGERIGEEQERENEIETEREAGVMAGD